MDLGQCSCSELPWKTRLLVNTMSFAWDASQFSDLIHRFLLLVEPKSPPSTKPMKGVTSSDVSLDPSRGLWFRLYIPSSSSATVAALPLIIYFHGGGFVSLAPDSFSYDHLCRKLARELQAIVVSVNYRLAPTHRYPSQYDDGFDTLKFIDTRNYAVLPPITDLNRCFLAGDSAGANIAHHVTLRAGEHEFKKLQIIGFVSIQPFFGGEERTESELRLTGAPVLNTKRTDWMWRSFLPQGSDRNHEAVNVFGAGSKNSGDISAVRFPATVIFVGGCDPLQDWQRRYHEGLKKSGKEVQLVEYPNAIHAFYLFPELPQLRYLIADMEEFIQKQSARIP
ncbi:hypothetical protein U1Q18_023114 [Sarracenia purpurea var. burkii]